MSEKVREWDFGCFWLKMVDIWRKNDRFWWFFGCFWVPFSRVLGL